MAKSKPKSPLSGRWRIVSMEQWDEEFIDEEEEGYIEFDGNGMGSFHFGYVHGNMDCQATTREGQPAVEWSWDGSDEMEAAQGRGMGKTQEEGVSGTVLLIRRSYVASRHVHRLFPWARERMTVSLTLITQKCAGSEPASVLTEVHAGDISPESPRVILPLIVAVSRQVRCVTEVVRRFGPSHGQNPCRGRRSDRISPH